MVSSSSHVAGGNRHLKLSKSQRQTNRRTKQYNKAISSGKMTGTYQGRIRKADTGKMRLRKIGRKTKRSRN